MSSSDETPDVRRILEMQDQLAQFRPITFVEDDPCAANEDHRRKASPQRIVRAESVAPTECHHGELTAEAALDAAMEESIEIIAQLDAIAKRMILEPTLRFDPMLSAKYDGLLWQLLNARSRSSDAKVLRN
jgi:hypothetical protein